VWFKLHGMLRNFVFVEMRMPAMARLMLLTCAFGGVLGVRLTGPGEEKDNVGRSAIANATLAREEAGARRPGGDAVTMGSFGVPESPMPFLPFLYDPWAQGMSYGWSEAGLFLSDECHQLASTEALFEVGVVEYPAGHIPRTSVVFYMGNEYSYVDGAGIVHGCYNESAMGNYSKAGVLRQALQENFPVSVNMVLKAFASRPYNTDLDFRREFLVDLIGSEGEPKDEERDELDASSEGAQGFYAAPEGGSEFPANSTNTSTEQIVQQTTAGTTEEAAPDGTTSAQSQSESSTIQPSPGDTVDHSSNWFATMQHWFQNRFG